VVGAVFGQTEGLLGEELDLRDLQKSGRIGRIEVEVSSRKGKSEGKISIPSSLDQVETSILASSLETIDRVGPCKAKIKVEKVEDVRVTKRMKIVDRAKELLKGMIAESKNTGMDLTESVKAAVQVHEIVTYGPDRLPKLLEGYAILRECYWVKADDNSRWLSCTKERALAEVPGQVPEPSILHLSYGLGGFILCA